jgi:hypothetical protein
MITKEDIRSTLTAFDFERLFLSLGWDRYRHVATIDVGDQTYTLTAIAHKRGMVAFLCVIAPNHEFPDRSIRLKIEKILARIILEHILIFVDEAKTIQEWQWSKREPGRPLSVKKETVLPWQSGERLAQRLMNLAFTIQEEETLTLVDVTSRVRRAFDADAVTKKFYEQFSKEHDYFLTFIGGIPDLADREWYASLMLNRLMFVYFVQKKGFLDGDHNYLRERLSTVKMKIGPDRFHSFYRSFLLRLFHDGLGRRDRSPELTELLGRVPYLNGGIFDVHSLEASHPEIEIPDEAFERIFGFFDDYTWHLDDRPLRDDKEINPDVLGFIFEKYINNKQMGAYYTKEDITEYICRNTVIPWIFDEARRHVPIAFERGSAMWRLLQDNPDRYIYEPVRRGVDIPENGLPDFVRQAMGDPRERMLNRQYNLVEARLLDDNGNSVTLPTETWREYIERRERCRSLRSRLREGSVTDISELVTLNLDLRQFAQDALEASEGPDLLRSLFRAVQNIKILDPTCGSGAFLFAALNILEPLYEACLDRMSAFVEDADTLTEIRTSGAAATNWKGELNFDVLIGQGTFSEEVVESVQFADFRRTLAGIDLHTNKRYFIFKSIVIANLFGVDIMPEAVEICKLRLFLKLV